MQKLERILGIPSADFFVFVFVFFFSNLKRHEFRSESFGFVPFSWVVLAGRAPGNRSLLELNVSSAFVVMCEPSAVFLVTHWLACWKVFLKTRLFDCNWCTEATLDVASSYAVSVVTETKKKTNKKPLWLPARNSLSFQIGGVIFRIGCDRWAQFNGVLLSGRNGNLQADNNNWNRLNPGSN